MAIEEMVKEHGRSLKAVRQNRRNRYDMLLEILEFCREARGKTDIMYYMRITYKYNEAYLKVLVNNNLLIWSGEFFTTSMLGYEVIRLIGEVKRLIGDKPEHTGQDTIQ